MSDARIIVVFRNDDVSALSDLHLERKVARIFMRYHAPQTIGVIPFCALNGTHNPHGQGGRALETNRPIVDLLNEMVLASAAEIAMHGYCHRTNMKSNPKRREYFEFRDIPFQKMVEQLTVGLLMISRTLGHKPTTFIPPWNRLDENAVRACAVCGFRVVSAGAHTPPYDGLVSFGTNCSLFDFFSVIEKARSSLNLTFLHVLYHSGNLKTAGEIDALERALAQVRAEPRCEVMTIRQVAETYAEQLKAVNEAAKSIEHPSEIRNSLHARGYLYYRLLSQVKLENRLKETKRISQEHFRAGNYSESIRAGSRFESELRNLVRFFKSLLALISTFPAFGVVFIPYRSQWRITIFVGWLCLQVAIGIASFKAASSIDTRKEITI
jgi:peptidoglycan/xylan/chitin deacetylase (PgdA/CDA1 family)